MAKHFGFPITRRRKKSIHTEKRYSQIILQSLNNASISIGSAAHTNCSPNGYQRSWSLQQISIFAVWKTQLIRIFYQFAGIHSTCQRRHRTQAIASSAFDHVWNIYSKPNCKTELKAQQSIYNGMTAGSNWRDRKRSASRVRTYWRRPHGHGRMDTRSIQDR